MASPSERSDEAAWSELEQAFFASAPPDDPPAAPTDLDDPPRMPARRRRDRLHALGRRALTSLAATRATLLETARRLRAAPRFTASFAALTTPRLSRRGVAIALASAIVLMGLSAGVVASLSGGSAGAPVATEVATGPTSSRGTDIGAAVRTRESALPRPHTRAAKHSHARASAAKHAHHEHRKVATGHTAR